MDCSECQHHYSQNGKCIENKNNCLYYLEEPRGKMLRTNFSFTILADAETPVIKPGAMINTVYLLMQIQTGLSVSALIGVAM